MVKHLDIIFSPGLYLEREKRAFVFIKNRLLQQEPCAVVTMYGNGKDYLFHNVVKEFEKVTMPYTLKVLNTISEDELRDFATLLEAETEPTLCMVNLRIGKDVSWFVHVLGELRFKRRHDFVSFVNSYVGDVYEALYGMQRPLVDSLVIKERVPYADAIHVIDELAERFSFAPTEDQKQEIYTWSCGHIGLLRSLFLLKQQQPDRTFDEQFLLHEPTILERLTHIISEIPQGKLQAILQKKANPLDITFFAKLGYTNKRGELFSPLLKKVIPQESLLASSAYSSTEMRVLKYFQKHQSILVSREDVARIVWGEEEWEEKFSDWAIGQLMYRLRKKLEYSPSSDTIQTQKGKGFIYKIKSKN